LKVDFLAPPSLVRIMFSVAEWDCTSVDRSATKLQDEGCVSCSLNFFGLLEKIKILKNIFSYDYIYKKID